MQRLNLLIDPTTAVQLQVSKSDSAPPQYAEVAVPRRVTRTFTYRLPVALRDEARIGARVLVPFGRKLTTAYIVALHRDLDPGVELDESEIKEAEELLDVPERRPV